jgi:DNA invertase Pin-like site-specific DNA recombinase
MTRQSDMYGLSKTITRHTRRKFGKALWPHLARDCAATALAEETPDQIHHAARADNRRPEFQRMIDTATSPAHPYDVILVHLMSRFFREQFLSEMYIRKLRKAGVELISI